MSGIAGSAGQRETDPGERPAGALPDRFRPPTAGPKLGVSLCPPAQFTLALAGELFPHVRVHGLHVARGWPVIVMRPGADPGTRRHLAGRP